MATAAKPAGGIRSPSQRLAGVRRATLAGLERYSNFVRIMKRALPIAAGVVVAAVLIYTLQPRETNQWAMTWENQTEIENDLTMVRPRLLGADENGSPFTVTADTAVQDGPTALKVRLNNVRAQITMQDGLWVRLDARQGYVDSEKQELDLTGGIRLTADGGYEAHTTNAHFDLAAGTVTGRNPVSGRGPYGTYRARGFELRKEQRQLVFTGGVSMLLNSAEARR
jgi:lipopolysaccharide export system protein LptC